MLLTLIVPARAYDLTDKLSIGGVLAGAAQCQDLSENGAASDACRRAVAFQPELSFRPNDANQFFVKLGFASGNGLDPVSPFVLAPWAADLEDGTKDINGRSRDHLLTAWYKRTFSLSEGRSLGLTGGIIDATAYIDDNAYANDEYNQFMNEVFVNASQPIPPAFDYGGAVEFDSGDWSFRAVVMNVGENDDGNNFNFYGGQIARTIKSSLGSGTYRLVIVGTNEQFIDPAGADKKSLFGLLFNADQELGGGLGAFVRIGWQKDDAAVNHDALASGGLSLGGAPWGRPDDNIGLAYAYLNGGSGDISATQVVEAYYRLAVHGKFALTGDVQYIKDELKAGTGPEGFIVALRGTSEF